MPLLDTRLGKALLGTFISDIVLSIFSYAADPALWAIVADHARFVATPAATRLSRRTDYVRAKHRIAPNTLLRYRRIFPEQLAETILVPPADDPEWRLQS